jgi:hypothetical protein
VNKENIELWKNYKILDTQTFLTDVEGKPAAQKMISNNTRSPKILIDFSSQSAMFPAVNFNQVINYVD